jgi:hypothetical protein
MEPQQEAPRPKLTSLTDTQVELLSVFMKERFDGFVSGRLYTFERIVPPDRVQFLWFETSLLLCLLTADLESASDAEDYWNRIAPPLLTQLSPGITDPRMNEILTAARGYRDTWMMHEHDGPLGKILDAPILAAFDCDYDDCFAYSFRSSWRARSRRKIRENPNRSTRKEWRTNPTPPRRF